jgi:hypothetical protein
MYLAPGSYRRIEIHQDGGITIDLDESGGGDIISSQPTAGRPTLESIWIHKDLTFKKFISTLSNQGRLNREGTQWLGTGTQLRALYDILYQYSFIIQVSRNRFFELAKATFDMKLKRRESMTAISPIQYDQETQFLQNIFFTA